MNYTNKKLYYINSNNRKAGTHSNMLYEIRMDNIRPTHLNVLQVNIPKSYFMVQSGENTFTLTENGADATITLSEGNYTRSNLRTNLQTVLNTASPNGWTYTITQPNSSQVDDGKYTFNVSGNGGLQPSFTFGSNNLHELLGFEANSVNAFSGDSLKSIDVIKLQLEDNIYIRSDICGKNTDNNILQTMNPLDFSDYDNMVFTNHAPELYEKEMNGEHSSTFTFTITNENGTILDLNGQNWTMVLCVYNKESITDMFKKYLQFLH